MELSKLTLPPRVVEYYKYKALTPVQEKAINAGLLEKRSLLVCAPTASGKTFVATMAILKALDQGKKALYVVPLKALASEKWREFKDLLAPTNWRCGLAIGEVDAPSDYLATYDLLILTTEKLDSLLRHKIPWLQQVQCVVLDEIHLLNDPSRGPTLEIIITLLKMLIQPQLIGLSATIGNPADLAEWLGAELVQDDWRPVELKQGIAVDGKTEFY